MHVGSKIDVCETIRLHVTADSANADRCAGASLTIRSCVHLALLDSRKHFVEGVWREAFGWRGFATLAGGENGATARYVECQLRSRI